MKEEENDIQWRILKTLEDISGKIDTLIFLQKVGEKNELILLKEQVLGNSKNRRQIYDLCNGDLTLNDIANKVNQKLPNVSVDIHILEEAGLIKIKKVGTNKFPQKIDLF